jgi:hypothetical protein
VAHYRYVTSCQHLLMSAGASNGECYTDPAAHAISNNCHTDYNLQEQLKKRAPTRSQQAAHGVQPYKQWTIKLPRHQTHQKARSSSESASGKLPLLKSTLTGHRQSLKYH